MSKRNPTPWVNGPGGAYEDAFTLDGRGVLFMHERARIVRAVNAYESPLACAERGLLRAVDRWLGTSNMDGKNNERLAAVGVAHKCLLKARAKARGSK